MPLPATLDHNDIITHSLFGPPSVTLGNYLNDKFTNFYNAVSEKVGDVKDKFILETKNIMQSYNSNTYIDAARKAVLKFQGKNNEFYIQCLDTDQYVRKANTVMQRWIMAMPELREKYIKQTIDGFSSTYSNTTGDLVGDEHIDYQMVMDGIVNDDMSFNHYIMDMNEGDRLLTVEEKVSILDTWQYIKFQLLIDPDKDLTDPDL